MNPPLHRYSTLSTNLGGIELRPLADPPKDVLRWPDGDPSRFLGRFGREELLAELQIHGALAPMLDLGHTDVGLVFDSGPEGRSRMRIDGSTGLLLELVVWREYVEPLPSIGIAQPLRVLSVEYLRSQRPGDDFRRERLPGQRAPGLGVGNQILALLRNWSVRMSLDGVLALPDYFHAAVLYERGFTFVDPEMQGLLQAAQRDVLDGLSLARASWRFELDGVRLRGPLARSDGAWRWPSEPELIPTCDALTDWFAAPAYRSRAEETAAAHRFETIPSRAPLADARAAPDLTAPG